MSADGQDLCFNFHILRQRRCSLPASLQPDELSGGVFSLDAPVDAEESEVNNTARAFPESQAVIQRRNTALGNYGVTPRRRSEDDTGTDSSTEILYCEDDAVQRVAVRQVLKSHFKFGTTRSGEKTLEVLAQRFASGGLSALPNIVLMDQELPGLSGLETVSAIRSLYPRASMSIIMLTSTEKDEAATERKTGRLAYHRYLVKPVRRANLVDAVNCEATRLQSRANRLAKRATMA
jgi:CheY-like chemotaxis protein